MVGLRTLVVGAAALAVSGVAARAADMPDYSSPLPFPSREQSLRSDELYSGWYLRGDVGYRFQRVGSAADLFNDYATNSIKNDFMGSVGAGYKMQWFRADLTGDYGLRSLYSGATASGTPTVSAKIDSFTVKQGLKAVNCGQDRLPEWEPSRITFPDISVHMTMHYAADVIAWYEKTIVKGFRCDKVQRTGAIEFLDTNKRDVIFSIALDQVGIKSLTIDKSEKQDAMKKIKFDIFCSKMAIDGKPLVG